MALELRIKLSRKIPYLLEFIETPRFRYPHIAFAMRIDFVFCRISEKSRENVELLFPPSSSFFFPLFLLSLSLPVWSNLIKWDVLSCHVSPSHWLSWITPYPHIWISFLLCGDTCPTWVPLILLFDLSPFDAWLHMSHPTCAKCDLSLLVLRKT